MKIEKVNPDIKYIYHYTLKENVEKILKDKSIKSKDPYVFFTKSYSDSILTFEREMMQENKLYFDLGGVLRKRKKCNKEDYCILKIPYINDNKFCRFIFDNQSKDSIYSISLSHKGEYKFENVEILEFPKQKNKILNVLSKTAIVAIATGIMFFPNNTYAASWLDAGNYDSSWFDDSTQTRFEISTAKELAGLAYLVKYEGLTFEGKEIKLLRNIDLTENTWEVLSDTFKGEICGGHRIILNCLDKKFAEDEGCLIDDVTGLNNALIAYPFYVYEGNEPSKKILAEKPYTIGKLKEQSCASAVFFKNEIVDESKSLFDLEFEGNDTFEIVKGEYIYIQGSDGKKIPLGIESDELVESVLRRYSQKVGISSDRLTLSYSENILENEQTIGNYSISNADIIYAHEKVNINMSVEEGKGEISCSQDNLLYGDNVKIMLEPDSDYELSKLVINGNDKTKEVHNNELQILCDNIDIDIKVSYKLKVTPEEVVEEADNNNNSNNPPTGDNIVSYIIAFIVSTVGIIFGKKKI